jgi:hypothetical protein
MQLSATTVIRAATPITPAMRAPLSNEQLRKVAPSIFADGAHDSRSGRYTYIPTIAVLDRLRDEGYRPFAAMQSRVRDANKREHTKHMIRLRQLGSFNLERGQEVNEIVMVNSHDGTSAYQLMPGVFRVVCSNGLVSGHHMGEIRIPHKGDVLNDVIEGVFRVVEDFELIDSQKDGMRQVQLAPQERLAFARSALALKYIADDETNDMAAPIEAQQLLQVRRHADKQNDLWTTFNIVQENMIKGGLRGRTANNRRTSTRAVQGIDQGIKLNRALWTLAEEMRKLKA